MLATIELLENISSRCLADQPLDEWQRRWLGRVLAEFLAHRSPSIEDAMKLRGDRGGIPWWREQANHKRDVALRELAGRYFAGLSTTAQARQVRLLAIREMPVHYTQSAHEWLWRAFSSGAPMPIGERQLRTIFAR
jgi:hypothetical protein